MAITLIENQAVRFRLLTEIEAENCDCGYKPYCQKVNKNDVSKVQILSSDIVDNGNFASNLDGWEIGEAITGTVEVVNESAEDECDGSITVAASGGTGPYTYSIDGVTFQSSNVFEDLCKDCYNIIIKDADGNLGFVSGCVDTNVDCSDYNTPFLYDLRNTPLSQLRNCELNDLK